MSTKAQAFKAQQQREAHPPKPKQPPRKRKDTNVDTAQPGVSATDRKVGNGSTATRNQSARAEKKGGAALEDSATGKPSRKSTRKSARGGALRSSNLRRKTIDKKVSAPKALAIKAKASKR